MPTVSLCRKISILLLGLALALPWRAAAAPHREPDRRAAAPAAVQEPLELAGRLWRFLAGLRPADPTDTGCHDPNGCRVTLPDSYTSSVDTGCHIDPDGCVH